jgi:hypothetical protein
LVCLKFIIKLQDIWTYIKDQNSPLNCLNNYQNLANHFHFHFHFSDFLTLKQAQSNLLQFKNFQFSSLCISRRSLTSLELWIFIFWVSNFSLQQQRSCHTTCVLIIKFRIIFLYKLLIIMRIIFFNSNVVATLRVYCLTKSRSFSWTNSLSNSGLFSWTNCLLN